MGSVVRKIELQQIVEIGNQHVAANDDASFSQRRDQLPFPVELVLYLAKELLDEVLTCDQATGATVLIKHDGQVALGFIETLPDLSDGQALGHKGDGAENGPQAGRWSGAMERKKVPEMHKANDVVDVLVKDGDTGVGRLGGELEHCANRLVYRRCHHARAGHGDLASTSCAAAEYVLQELPFVRVDQAGTVAFLDQNHDLLGRVHVGMLPAGGRTQEPKEKSAAAIQQDDQGSEHVLGRPLHRQRGNQGESFRILDRQRFGHQFAEHDLEGGQQEQDQGRGNTGGGGVSRSSGIKAQGQAREQGHDSGGDLLLAIDTQHDAGEGNADLAGSDIVVELVGILENRQYGPGQGVSLLSQLHDACLAGADRRELTGNIEGVEKDQHCDDQQDGQGG